MDSDELNKSFPPKSTKATRRTRKTQDATSEDSDLFDSSQIEEIEEGMSKKDQLNKREHWLKTKTQTKEVPKDFKDVSEEVGPTQNHDMVNKENEPQKTNNSSAEFFDLD